MLDKLVKYVAGLLGLMLLGIGFCGLIAPTVAAPLIGMEVLQGVAGSSQIGDLGAFFIVAGAFALLGLGTGNAALLYTPAALVGAAAVYRTVAGLAHGVAFAPELIILELVMCRLFLMARNRIAATQ
ncbi:MAG TPA: hypothetical protein VIV27_07770 [Halioglobus sp.]